MTDERYKELMSIGAKMAEVMEGTDMRASEIPVLLSIMVISMRDITKTDTKTIMSLIQRNIDQVEMNELSASLENVSVFPVKEEKDKK